MFKIGLVILALIAMVGMVCTTTHYAFVNDMSSGSESDTSNTPISGFNAAASAANHMPGSEFNGGTSESNNEDTPAWYTSHGWHHHNAEGGLQGYWHHGTHPGWMDVHGGATSYPYHMSPEQTWNYEYWKEHNHHEVEGPLDLFGYR
jgi:hypothetical protein